MSDLKPDNYLKSEEVAEVLCLLENGPDWVEDNKGQDNFEEYMGQLGEDYQTLLRTVKVLVLTGKVDKQEIANAVSVARSLD